MSHKHTLEFIQSKFKERNCRLLDTTYKDAHTKLHYVAACGHDSYINWNNFRTGSGTLCPACADTKKSYEYIKSEFNKRGCTLLSNEYNGSYYKLEYVAKCGHVNSISWSNFQRGYGDFCPKCSNLIVASKNRIPITDIAKIFESRGCHLLSTDRTHHDEKLKYIASCGHIHYISYGNFNLGHGTKCPKCAKHDLSENFIGESIRSKYKNVIEQYAIDDKKGGVLRLDFFIPELNLAIEYNGRQHYGPQSFFGGEKRWKEQQKRDKRKRDWCESQGIKLVEIDGRLIDCRKSTRYDVLDYIEKNSGVPLSTQP